MSAIDFTLDTALRTDMGKGASRRLRRNNLVPGIIYGGSADPVSVTVPHNVLIRKLEDEVFYSHILKVTVDGKAEKAVLKDLQRHPARAEILHFDLQRVDENEVIHMHVPVHFVNEEKAPGVKAGGQVVHAFTSLDITCKGKDLPEYIEVDLGGLELGGAIHLSEIALPAGVTLVELTHGEGHDQSIVSIKGKGGAAEEEESAAEGEAEGE